MLTLSAKGGVLERVVDDMMSRLCSIAGLKVKRMLKGGRWPRHGLLLSTVHVRRSRGLFAVWSRNQMQTVASCPPAQPSWRRHLRPSTFAAPPSVGILKC